MFFGLDHNPLVCYCLAFVCGETGESLMKSFWRVFKYVRPQWHRVVIIVLSAVLIGILFSLSFMTIGPLLKVMMGEEGLHGWADRKICEWRYGISFYVPDKVDFAETTDIAYYLLVTGIEDDESADLAGIEQQDRIVGLGSLLLDEDTDKTPSAQLLEQLATTDEQNIVIQIEQTDLQGQFQDKQIVLNMAEKPSYVNHIKWAMSFIPKGQNKAQRKSTVIYIILIMAIVTTMRCIATFYQKYFSEKIVQIAIAGLRQDAFAHTMNMPMGFFGTEGTSDTISRIIGDTATAGKGVKVLLGKTLREPLKAFFTLAGAMLISSKLTLIFLCCAPITVGLLGLLGRKIKKATRKTLISSALMLGKLEDAISALRVVKVYNRQGHECRSYEEINRSFLRRVLRVAKVDAATGPIMETLGMIAGSAALLVGVYWIFSPGSQLQPTSFFLLLVLLGTAAESIRKVSDVWNKIQQANAASERVFAIINQPAEIEKPNAVELAPLKEQIEFSDITFTYPGTERAVLKSVNFKVDAGQTVAIVGPNGSGKTTLVNLIPRFYDADSGSILIDGQDIQDGTLKSLRSQIGMVTQNVVTFNDTIAANIAYGKADATQEQIISAAKRCFVHEFIEPLPDGYDTIIGEHGSGFSGGQLQRIVIARAILKDPPILIFDEAMSQVDADSEAKIHKALSGLMAGRTCFVIAHRFSTVVSADTIAVMQDGQIIAQGSHNELFQDCLLYKNLYETQLLAPQ